MSAIVPVDSATSARVSLPERSPWVPAAPPRAAAVPPPAVGSVALTLLPAQRTDAARAALGSAAVIEVSLVLIDDLVSMLGAVLDDVRAGRPVPAAQLAALTQLAKASILPALLLASPPQAQGTLPGGVPPGSAAVLPPVTGAVPGAGTIAGQGVPVVVPPPAGGVSWPTAPRLLLVLGSTPLAVLLPAGIPGEPRAAAVALQAALAGTGLTVNLGSGPDVGTVQLQGPTGDIELWTAGGGGRPEAWQALLRGPAQAVAATSMSAMLTAAVESGDPALVEAALTRLLEARPALQAA